MEEKERIVGSLNENKQFEISERDKKIDELQHQVFKLSHFEEREQEYLKKI